MSQFTIDSIEELEYDFTKITHNDQPKTKNATKKFCTGAGLIPEPTERQLEAYSIGIKRLFGMEMDAVTDETKAEVEKKIQAETAEDTTDKLMALTSALCQGSPSKAELKNLPPRYRNGFLKWVYAEVSNPEVSTGATPDSE